MTASDYAVREHEDAFCLEIDFARGSRDPARVFRAMHELIDIFQEVDTHLARVIDVRIEPTLVLEDIQVGSLRTWIRDRVLDLDEDDLRNLDWRRIVGRYLVAAKGRLLRFVDGRQTIESRDELLPLERDLMRLATDTRVHPMDAYTPVPARTILATYQHLSSAIVSLDDADRVSYVTKHESVELNRRFQLSDDAADRLLVQNQIENIAEMILKVKKPDFLGTSMWELRHHEHPIYAKILDEAWLRQFQSRSVTVRPGDSLRARVRTTVLYDDHHEVISQRFEILEVLDVLEVSPGEQGSLPTT